MGSVLMAQAKCVGKIRVMCQLYVGMCGMVVCLLRPRLVVHFAAGTAMYTGSAHRCRSRVSMSNTALDYNGAPVRLVVPTARQSLLYSCATL